MGTKLSNMFSKTMKMKVNLNSDSLNQAHKIGKNGVESCVKNYVTCKHLKAKCDIKVLLFLKSVNPKNLSVYLDCF